MNSLMTPLTKQLQEWCGGVGQVLDLDIQMSKGNILWMLPGIIKANKDFKCYTWGDPKKPDFL